MCMWPARGKKPATKFYALDEGELVAILDKCAKDGVPREKCPISRFKGLGAQLMGKGEAAARRELMELRGYAVEIDV